MVGVVGVVGAVTHDPNKDAHRTAGLLQGMGVKALRYAYLGTDSGQGQRDPGQPNLNESGVPKIEEVMMWLARHLALRLVPLLHNLWMFNDVYIVV